MRNELRKDRKCSTWRGNNFGCLLAQFLRPKKLSYTHFLADLRVQSTAAQLLAALQSTNAAQNDNKNRGLKELVYRSLHLRSPMFHIVDLEQNLTSISKAAMRKTSRYSFYAIERCVDACYYYYSSRVGASPSTVSFAFR